MQIVIIYGQNTLYTTKKFFFFAFAAMMLASCTTSTQTASEKPVSTVVLSTTTAELKVGQKITYTYKPTAAVAKGGMRNIKATAIAEALKANGGGDVLVESQEATVIRKGLFGKKVKSITVTGYVGTYTNFKNVDPASIPQLDLIESSSKKLNTGGSILTFGK